MVTPIPCVSDDVSQLVRLNARKSVFDRLIENKPSVLDPNVTLNVLQPQIFSMFESLTIGSVRNDNTNGYDNTKNE